MSETIRRPFHRKPVSRRAALGASVAAVLGAGQLQNVASAATSAEAGSTTLASSSTGAGRRVMGAAAPSGGSVWSGAALPNGPTEAMVAAHGAWRGRPLDVLITYNNYDTMDTIAASSWAVDMTPSNVSRVAAGVSLLSTHGSESFADVAAGYHDGVFANLAKSFAASRPDTIIRLAWEANGKGWYRWQPTRDQLADFKSAFRRVAGIFKAASPSFVIDYTLAADNQILGETTNRLGPLTDLYPGDDVVDIVGIDVYDQYALRSDLQQSRQVLEQPGSGPGLEDVLTFAQAHGKAMSIPEWGAVASWDNGGGDSPEFIHHMRSWIAEHSADLAYEAYFHNYAVSPYTMLYDSGFSSTALPSAAQAYSSNWNF